MKNTPIIALLCLSALAAAQTSKPTTAQPSTNTTAQSPATSTAQTPATTTAAADVSGKWTMHSSVAGNDSDSECTFTQTGNDLSGSCGAADQPVMKFTGKVDGSKISWSVNGEYNGTPLTMKYTGTLANGKITGDVNIDPFGVTGEFSATRAK